ncbi:MAG: hypothetical protein AB7U85_05270 [Alphaproteobacteria bacterium]
MSNNLAGSYYLANDIDCSDTINWNSGAGFVPIGSKTAPFLGKLNGRGFAISNLVINRPTNYYIGLFGYTDGAEIFNIGLSGINFSGANGQNGTNSASGSVGVGGVGSASGRGGCGCGGVYSDSSGYGDISNRRGGNGGNANCGSGGSGGFGNGGGGCGSGASINTWSYGGAGGGSGGAIGGIIGYANSTILNDVYVTGVASGANGGNGSNGYYGGAGGGGGGGGYVGGLVGYSSSNSINNSYAVVAVSGARAGAGGSGSGYGSYNGSSGVNGYVGGLIALCSGSCGINSYWDTQISGVATSSGGIGKTTTDLKTQNTFSGWDFDTVWYMPTNNYPELRKQNCTGCAVMNDGICVAGDSCSGEHPNCVVTNNNGICECSSSSCDAGRSCSATGTCADCDASDGCGACGCGTSQQPTGTGTCMNNSLCCVGECNKATGANSCSYSDDLCPTGVSCNRSTLSCCANELPYWRSENCRSCSSTSGLSGNCTTQGMMCNSNYDCVSCFANMQCTCDDGFVADGSGGCVEPLCFADSECGVDKCINAGQYNAFCSNCSSTNKVWVSGSCESCPSGSTYHNGICLCSDGKLWNSASNICAKKSLISTKGVIDTKSKATQNTPESRYDRIKRKMNRITNSAYAGFADKEVEAVP